MSGRTEGGLRTCARKKKRRTCNRIGAERGHRPLRTFVKTERSKGCANNQQSEYTQNREVGMPRLWWKLLALAGNNANKHWSVGSLCQNQDFK